MQRKRQRRRGPPNYRDPASFSDYLVGDCAKIQATQFSGNRHLQQRSNAARVHSTMCQCMAWYGPRRLQVVPARWWWLYAPGLCWLCSKVSPCDGVQRGEGSPEEDVPWALRDPEDARALLAAAAAEGMPQGRVERLALLHLLVRMHREAHDRTGAQIWSFSHAACGVNVKDRAACDTCSSLVHCVGVGKGSGTGALAGVPPKLNKCCWWRGAAAGFFRSQGLKLLFLSLANAQATR